MSRFYLLAIPLLWSLAGTRSFAADHAPGQFEHHADIRIELFAAEPDVVDPVSLTFAANGDCYVVEMRDYPYGMGDKREPGGSIRILRDRDRDGRCDESKLFATGLSFPTSILAYEDGVLVVAPPEILFLRDTDGDDVADDECVVVSGLRRGVTDSNANGLNWGIDNRVHVANGGNGGRVRIGDPREQADRGDQVTDLGNSDFAIDFASDTILKTGRTGGGFGLVFDDFGHSFTTHNLNYLQQRIIPTRYIEQSPEMFSFAATENISDHGISARIYPIVQAVTRVNHPEQAGRFSSSGGMGILNQGDFSARLANSIFICDVVCNLVHRDVLRPHGPQFRAGRAAEEQTSEFIASRDPACRPVGLEPGPDGALYLIDMQRDVIEHPDYIPKGVRDTLDIRAGEDRGRIYRVLPVDGLPAHPPALADAANDELVAALESTSRWHRNTAHRLLIERDDFRGWARQDSARSRENQSLATPATSEEESDLGTVAQLRKMLTSESAEARVRTLWILQHLVPLTVDDLQLGLSDPDPSVRENMALIIEQRMNNPVGFNLLLASAKDDHARVRFQAALSLGIVLPSDDAGRELKQQMLQEILLRDFEYAWSRRAVLLSIDEGARRLLMDMWDLPEFQGLPGGEAKLALIRELAEVAAATEAADQPAFVAWLSGLNVDQHDSPMFVPQFSALLSGLFAGWQRRGVAKIPSADFAAIADRWAASGATGFEAALTDLISLYQLPFPAALQKSFDTARKVVADPEAAMEARIAAIGLISRDTSDATFELLISLLSAPEPTAIQQSAVVAIGKSGRADAGSRLLDVWSQTLPGVRGSLIGLLLSRREHQEALLTALENGTVDFSELNLDLEQRRRLLRHSTREISKRSAKFFSDEEYSNRKSIVGEWLTRLPAQGDPTVGREVFTNKCATCHVIGGAGNRVGPDLQAMSHRSVEDLLSHILDPNMSINPNYVSCVLETVDGQILNGLLAEETADSVTLRQAEGKTQTIERAEIQQLKTLKTSLMPEGLEKELTPAQMRSLIAYLQEF